MTNSINIIQYSDLKIFERKDFYSKFNKLLKDLFETSDITLFSHHVISNYRKENHTVSSFFTNEEWSKIYWTQYYDNDPLERAFNSAALRTGFALSSFKTVDPMSECMQSRMNICKVKDGILASFKHPHNIIENMSFGWQNLDTNPFLLEKVMNLIELVTPLREHHISTHNLG